MQLVEITSLRPDFHVSTISPVSIDRFSPNFCHWCILGHRWPDYVFGSKGQSSRSHHCGGGAQHSTLPSSATFSSLFCFANLEVALLLRYSDDDDDDDDDDSCSWKTISELRSSLYLLCVVSGSLAGCMLQDVVNCSSELCCCSLITWQLKRYVSFCFI